MHNCYCPQEAWEEKVRSTVINLSGKSRNQNPDIMAAEPVHVVATPFCLEAIGPNLPLLSIPT